MLILSPAEPLRRVLAIGCHADDIEIGCGGTLLTLVEANPELEVDWVVLASPGDRAEEARASAASFLAGAANVRVEVHEFRDGFLPYVGGEVKDVFEDLKGRVDPQIVFTHAGYDYHQDHRLACELTWNTFRRHLILEYEIPKVDGDLGRPNVFFPLSSAVVERKLDLLEQTLPEPGRQALVRPGDVPRPDAAARDGSGRAGPLRGGVHGPEGGARLVRFVPTRLEGAYVVEPEPHRDERGFFARSWDREEFGEHGLATEVVQCSFSRNTHAGTLRGLHFQTAPHEEVKLVRCTAGAIFDVIVDLREGSPTHGEWLGVRLDAEHGNALYVPKGFAHGFQTLVDGAEVFYMMADPYVPEAAAGRALGRPGLRDRVAAGRAADDRRARPRVAGLPAGKPAQPGRVEVVAADLVDLREQDVEVVERVEEPAAQRVGGAAREADDQLRGRRRVERLAIRLRRGTTCGRHPIRSAVASARSP